MPSTQKTLQGIFKNAKVNTQAPQEFTQQTQQVQVLQTNQSTQSVQSQANAAAPKSQNNNITKFSDIPQPRVSRVKEILAGGVSKAQEPAQQGQINATTQPNVQPTYKPKSRRR